MTQQQKMQIDQAARTLVRRVREGNDAVARHGGKKLDAEQYKVLESELRQRLERRARNARAAA